MSEHTSDELVSLLCSIVDADGISIKFGAKNRAQDPLTEIIAEAIKKANGGSGGSSGSGGNGGSNQPQPLTADDIAKAVAEALKPTMGSLKAIEESNKKQEGLLEKLEEDDEEGLSDSQKRRLVEAGAQAIFSIFNSTYKATKNKFGWLKDLESSGIRLAGGFEESFTQLANDAKLSHDTFTKMLVANSKQVAKMNALGSETMSSMMKASGNLVGKFGYTAEDASKVMLHYMETVGSVNTAEQMRNRDITKEVEALGKQMKSLSLATGKSVDVLIQEQEQRRKNLLMEKIARDPTMNALLTTGLNAGISEDVMLAAITGRPNEASSQMNMTAGGRALNRTLQQIALGIKSGSVGGNDIVPMLASLQKDSRLVGDVNAIENMSYGKAGALNETALGNNLFSLSQFMRAALNPNAQNEVGNGSPEETAMNSLANLTAKKSELLNTHTDKLAKSLEDATFHLNLWAGTLSVVNTVLASWFVPAWLYKIGVGVVSTAWKSKALRSFLATKMLDKAWSVLSNPVGSASAAWKWMGTTASSVGTWLKAKGSALKSVLSKVPGKFTKLGTAIKSMSSWFGKLGKGLAKLAPKLLKGLGLLGMVSVLLVDELGDKLLNWMTGGNKGGLGYKLGSTALKALSWGIQGFLMGGPYGALAGAIAGLGYGIWKNWFSSDAESSDSSDTGSYPAQNNVYNTSNNTQINTTRESTQMRTNDLAKDVKKIANNSDELQKQRIIQEKAREDSKLASRSALVSVGYY